MSVESPERKRRRWRLGRVAVPNPPPPVQSARTRWSPARRWTAAGLAVVAVGMGWAVTSRFGRPAETFLTPEADAYVSTAHPETNYGAKPTLRVDATPKIRSYLRFRLAGLSGQVVRAELRLWSSTGDLVGYSVHPMGGGTWVEGGIPTENIADPGKAVARSGPFGPGSWSRVDVTRLVEGRDEVSLVLTTRSSQNIMFDSREGRYLPQLMVET